MSAIFFYSVLVVTWWDKGWCDWTIYTECTAYVITIRM